VIGSNQGTSKTQWVLVAILCLALFAAFIGRDPFFDRDEGEYATVARNMIERSDYIIPHVNDRAYYEKPALYFWLTALSFKLFGYNEAAGRLPSVLAGLALVGLMAWFGRRHGGDKLGLFGAVFGATTFLIALLARVALMDALLTLFTTATLVFYYEGLGRPNGRNWFWAAWISMGLAFLTKGPVGAVVPLGVVFFFHVLRGDLFDAIRKARFPSGIVLFLVVAGPWYALAFLREGERFWQGFFISQNVGRFVDVVLGHGAPLWFYIPVLLVMGWPWGLFGFAGFWNGLIKNWRNRKSGGLMGLDYFLAIWLVTSFVIFSLAATKQPNYVMPSVPPLILLAGRWWQNYLTREDTPFPWAMLGITALLGIILAGVFVAAGFLIPEAVSQAKAGVNPDSFEYAFGPGLPDLGWFTPVWGILVGLSGLAALWFGKVRQSRHVLALLITGAAIFCFGFIHLTGPRVLYYLQAPAKTVGITASQTVGPKNDLAAFGLYKPTLWFYTGHHIRRIRTKETDALKQYLAREETVYLLSRLSLLPVISEAGPFEIIRQEGGYVFGANKAGGKP
jgi:4-amino-4-deoxy-L-arabinose transferase-like glycosyltransferase